MTEQTFTLENDDDRDVSFRGTLLADVRTPERGGRWTEIRICRTTGGSLVAHEVGRTTRKGERDRFSVHVAETADELIEKLGTGTLAKDAYAEAGIPCVKQIE